MRTYRLATPKDVPALIQLATAAKHTDVELPSLAFVAEEGGELLAAVGIELSHPGMVVLSGGIIRPDHYRNPFLVFRLQEAVEDWLIKQKCFAYVFSVSKRNTRMQRWMEKLGARRYTKKNQVWWYLRTIGPASHELDKAVA